jgi:hypothetical protein
MKNYNDMIKKIFTFMILQCIVIISYSQINSAFLNKTQKQVFYENLKAKGIVGYVELKYSSDKDLDNNVPSHYTIVFLDSLGKTQKTIEFDENKERGVYTVYEYDDLSKLRKKFNYKADNSILWIDEYLYDLSGELFETVQLDESGVINSKTLNYYNSDGYLNRAEVIGPDGNLTFNKSIKLNDKGLPVNVDLKHVRGFTMSENRIKYNENDLPSEKVMKIGMSGKTSRFSYNYNDDKLLLEQKSYEEGKTKINCDFKVF